ncbi:MAG: sulfotransferase [Candidatus Hodarchaeota archaeon]
MKGHFFIVGSGRCGTKFLRNMLILHPKVNICVETHFLPVLYDLYGLKPITFQEYFSVIDEHYDSKGSKWIYNLLRSEGKSYKGFKENFAEFCQNMKNGNIVDYTERLQEYLYGEGDYLVGDKTPHYGTIMTTLKKMWPNTKFIHLLRDGVYASQSMTKHPGFIKVINEAIPPTDLDRCSYKGRIGKYSSEAIKIKDAALFWKNVVVKTLEEARAISSSDYCEIRYEDLIRDPTQSLGSIAEFLGFYPDKKWVKKASWLAKPFFLNRIEHRMSKKEYLAVAVHIYETLQRFDYPLDDRYYSGLGFVNELGRSIGYGKNKFVKRTKTYINLVKRHVFN